MFQFETGHFGQYADHGGDTILLIVFAQYVDDFLVLVVQFIDTLLLFYILDPFGAPIFVIIDRITSYNVCYTKLLRNFYSKQCRYLHIWGTIS